MILKHHQTPLWHNNQITVSLTCAPVDRFYGSNLPCLSEGDWKKNQT